jgi:UDPglucose--hexose-1-phosphate uridylyltransferase
VPELRKDPITGDWILLSPERSDRPSDFGPEQHIETPGPCPFCAGNEAMTPPEVFALRQEGSQRWRLRVVPNKYPALRLEGAAAVTAEILRARMEGTGAHEVIIETPEHGLQLADLSPSAFADVIWTYRQRMSVLKADGRLRYTLVFRNHGVAAGASLRHAHSQLVALPIVPKRVTEELHGAEAYFRSVGSCVFCALLREELERSLRLVARTPEFAAIMPFASRFPFETWLLPIRHRAHFADLSEDEILEFSALLQEVLRRLRVSLADPPYNFLLHTTPYDQLDSPAYHWHLEILPKLTHVAGFEWGTGMHINPTPPESAAASLREADPCTDPLGRLASR